MICTYISSKRIVQIEKSLIKQGGRLQGMKKIKLLSMRIQNFKGCKDRTIEFGDKTRISGANATGKTTIFDAFTWVRREVA